jgi:hypothetical protein
MTNHFEKPKDWNVAPQSSWVSGTPVGQSEIRMPGLGDPGSHEDASQPVSFGDDDPQAEGLARIGPGGKMIAPGQPCPPGYKSESGACIPDPKSTASLEARQRSMQGKEEEKKPQKMSGSKSTEREVPRAPETNEQVKGLAKEGVKFRLGKQR